LLPPPSLSPGGKRRAEGSAGGRGGGSEVLVILSKPRARASILQTDLIQRKNDHPGTHSHYFPGRTHYLQEAPSPSNCARALEERLKQEVEVEITVLEFKTLKSDPIVAEER
jgi:hypothetical protein